MAAVVHFAAGLPVEARVALGAMVYGALVLALRVVTVDDLRSAART
jgi:hypothetical protein